MMPIRPAPTYVGTTGVVVYSIVLALVGLLIFQNLFGIWPEDSPADTVEVSLKSVGSLPDEEVSDLESRLTSAVLDTLQTRREAAPAQLYLLPFHRSRTVSWDVRLLLIALVMGALGSWIHCVSSFVRYVGNRQFVSSWGPWYVLRPALGAGLALIFYMVLRAGLAGGSSSGTKDINPYHVASFAALAGLFTQRASKKLAQVFDALLTPRHDDRDADELETGQTETGVPQIVSLKPQWVQVGTDPVTIQVQGSGFSENAVIKVAGTEVTARREGADTFSFTLDPRFRATKGTVEVVVESAAGASAPQRLTITP